MKSVLIVCTGNACRSQMAEALWRSDSNGVWEVESAGTHPAGVNSMARQVVEELGIDMSNHVSKNVDQFADRKFDVVVTVCDSAKGRCPIFSNAENILHWPFEDPITFQGSHQEVISEFRRVRDTIRARIQDYLRSNAV